MAIPVYAAQGSQYQSIIPNTTLAAETGNNTSAADPFLVAKPRLLRMVSASTTVPESQQCQQGNVHTLLADSQQGTKIYTTYIPYWVHGPIPTSVTTRRIRTR